MDKIIFVLIFKSKDSNKWVFLIFFFLKYEQLNVQGAHPYTPYWVAK